MTMINGDPRSIVAGDVGYRLDNTAYGTYVITVTSIGGIVIPAVRVYETTDRGIAFGAFDALDSNLVGQIERAVTLACTRMTGDDDLTEMTGTHPADPYGCGGQFCPDASCATCQTARAWMGQ